MRAAFRGSIMFTLRLPPDIEKRLDELARKTGRSKTFYAREAILNYLEDIEDYHLASSRFERGGLNIPLEEIERDLDERAKGNA